ncbi:MAG: ATP-binding cassette domain-containing protein [Gallionella sp.]|jgi:phospholipid/cholesterol/gamma-HCH transport system ATP-binding protein
MMSAPPALSPSSPPKSESELVSRCETLAPVIEIRNLCTRFGENVVHDNISLTVKRGEIFALVGGSGCGKSTLLRTILLLQRPASGSIRVFDEEVLDLNDEQAKPMRRRFGVMFERGALFGALTVAENVGMVLREHTQMSTQLIDEIARLKIALSGLPANAADKYPSELSGGMRKRAALARALALDPELLFLDEPTAGLDPLSAAGLDELVKRLRDALGLTIMLVTHDLDLLWNVADRVAVLGEGHILGIGTMTELSKMAHPVIRDYFYGPRGRTGKQQATGES